MRRTWRLTPRGRFVLIELPLLVVFILIASIADIHF